MKSFEFTLESSHPASDLWTALHTPIEGELGKQINPGLSLAYEGLSSHNRVQSGSRIIASPDSKKLRLLSSSLRDRLPEKITVYVDSDPTDSVRADTFEDDQIIEGRMTRKVQEAEGGGSLVIIEGCLAVKGLEEVWPSLLEDIDVNAIHYGVRKPNEKLIELLPEIMAQ